MLNKLKNIQLSQTVRRMGKGLLLLGLAVMTLSAVTFRQQAVITGLTIDVEGSSAEHLIDKTYLKNLLVKEFGSDLKSVPVEFIELSDIESLFNQNAYVKSAEVFVDKLGVLQIQVKERQPIMRIMDSDRSFYLDTDGVAVPLANNYTARLPIVFIPNTSQQFLTEKRRLDLLKLMNEINRDRFSKALTDQIEILPSEEYVIIPMLGSEKIRIGTTTDLRDKLSRMKLFYKEKIAKGHWSQCNYIDVRFKGQIVCDQNKP